MFRLSAQHRSRLYRDAHRGTESSHSLRCIASQVRNCAVCLALVLGAVGAGAVGAGGLASTAQAQEAPPLLRDSFLIGDEDQAACQVQTKSDDPTLSGMYDRAWTVICRDIAQPVGTIRLLYGDSTYSIEQRIASRATSGADNIPAEQRYTRREQRGKKHYIAIGRDAYKDALDLALDSILTNRVQKGEVNIPTITAGLASDQASGLARDIANVADIDIVLREAYRRNHSGLYADAADFFRTMTRRLATEAQGDDRRIDPIELILNRALQRSNLGEFAEAERLFADAMAMPTGDLVLLGLRRNYQAIHALNRERAADALSILATPLPAISSDLSDGQGNLRLSRETSTALNSSDSASILDDSQANNSLSTSERRAIIEAQATHLEGVAERMLDNLTIAREKQQQAIAAVLAVRGGELASLKVLRAEMLSERAVVEDLFDNEREARRYFLAAIDVLESTYPNSMILAAVEARYAAFLFRRGDLAEARNRYGRIIAQMVEQRRSLSGIINHMSPYFDMLISDIDINQQSPSAAAADSSNPQSQSAQSQSTRGQTAMADMFLAAQLISPPGVADTQLMLARRLAQGSNQASQLFRQSADIARQLEQAYVADEQFARQPVTSAIVQARAELATQISRLQNAQAEALAALADSAQYRAVDSGTMALAEFQATLNADETYIKTLVIGDSVYMLWVDNDKAFAWRADIDTIALDEAVRQMRDSISTVVANQRLTYPFDVARSHALYRQLFAPVADQIGNVHHIIYEPDGAMMTIPLGILVTSDAGIAEYQLRLIDPTADPFDTRGIRFLAHDSRISTVVSPIAFNLLRNARPSQATRQYIGMGDNSPTTEEQRTIALSDSEVIDTDTALDESEGCLWPVNIWNNPISPDEIFAAQMIFGEAQTTVLTKSDFTDAAIKQRGDLSDYRIIHFATHGLVTPPDPQCYADPALLTSFDSRGGSDGLLSFEEIFDLGLDADLVVLSACDTGATAAVSTTRSAGLRTGGGLALDGLVRAFVGAGARTVIASHWPVPDDYDATGKLTRGLFSAAEGTSIADSLWVAQRELMKDAETSHPYYWAGFVIIGDGTKPVRRATATSAASATSTTPAVSTTSTTSQ